VIYGYARVSTDGQTLDAQVAALTAAGAQKVYQEKVSGAKTDRPALAKAVAALDALDVLMVTRLDRLARSTRELLNVLATVSDRNAGFRSVAAPASPLQIAPVAPPRRAEASLGAPEARIAAAAAAASRQRTPTLSLRAAADRGSPRLQFVPRYSRWQDKPGHDDLYGCGSCAGGRWARLVN
jgi:Resolvase, N terminal domain